MLKTKWSTDEVRSTFIKFFEGKDHVFIHSSPLLPFEDPTLLFTNAGMNQFKPRFLGQVDPKSKIANLKRVANSQKCIRAGGKHNDLDDVGKDTYHHTFFEMLGNWSFGDYYKEEAISWAWELLTEVYGLDKSRIYVTYFGGNQQEGVSSDEEAKQIWAKYLPSERILPFGMKENFWEMGESGPCGPCSEIHYDRLGNRDVSHLVNRDDPTVIEIWNLVFIQYNRELDRQLVQLRENHVDTGMGLERITSILQGALSNYDIDTFTNIFTKIQEVANPQMSPYSGKLGAEDVDGLDTAYRVLADHIRTLTFAITDGIVPSNDGRGYVLRRVLRRAVRYGREMFKASTGFFHRLVPIVVETFGNAFPELKKDPQYIQDILKDEEEIFSKTLDKGLIEFKKAAQKFQRGDLIPGEVTFKLYDTYGFPLDLTLLMAEERGLIVKKEDFESIKQQNALNNPDKLRSEQWVLDAVQVSYLQSSIARTDSSFKYDPKDLENVELLAIYDPSAETEKDKKGFVQEFLSESKVGLIFDRTNFYAESGGQIYDTGRCTSGDVRFIVENVQPFGGFVLHIGQFDDATRAAKKKIKVHDRFQLQIDLEKRHLIMLNHTSTHLTNFALRNQLGDKVEQRGSLVVPERFRFDFCHNKPMTAQQLCNVDRIVNKMIADNLQISDEEVSYDSASSIYGLRTVPGEIYPDPVRIVSIGKSIKELLSNPKNQEWKNYSIEFCGGTHLKETSPIQVFTIISEEAVGKGVRRVTAVTGEYARTAIQASQEFRKTLQEISNEEIKESQEFHVLVTKLLNDLNARDIPAGEKILLREEISKLQGQLRKTVKTEITAHQQQSANYAQDTIQSLSSKQPIPSYFVGVLEVGSSSVLLTDTIKKIQESLSDTAIMLISSDQPKNKLLLVTNVPKSLVAKGFHANVWASETAKAIGGKGGGKPETAQGSSSLNSQSVTLAVQAAENYASQKLK